MTPTRLFERMLVPLDGSPNAESILYQAQRILCGKNTEVVLFHALGSASPGEAASSLQPQAAERYLKGVEKRLAASGARIRSLLRPGPLDAALHDLVRSEKITLVALSSHGRRADPTQPLAGRVQAIVAASDVPIFVSRAFMRGDDGGLVPSRCMESPLKRILVPLDGTGRDESILPLVRDLGLLLDALMVVARVGDQGSAARVDAAARTLESAGLQTVSLVLSGDPASAILDFAHPSSVDLVALTRGAAATRVLRESMLPTLLIHE